MPRRTDPSRPERGPDRPTEAGEAETARRGPTGRAATSAPDAPGPGADPMALRRALLARAKAAVSAERAVYFGLAVLDRQRHFVGALGAEPDTQLALDRGVEGRPALGATSLFEDGPALSQTARFTSARAGAPLPSTVDPLSLAVYQPFGVTDHARIVVHDGRRFAGWLGVLRTSKTPFQRRDLQRLDALARDMAAGLVRADRAHRAALASRPQLVVSADGVVQLRSEAGHAWGEGAAAAAIAEVVREVARDGGHDAKRLVAGAEATIARLFGGPESYLVTLGAPVAPELEPDVMLTERQREIAAHAVAGLSRGEIASRLAISEETVRHHLKLVYERLGVSSRVELANALRPDA